MFLSITPWKIAGIALAVLGTGAGVVAYQGTLTQPRQPAAAVAKPAPVRAARSAVDGDEPSPKYRSVMEHLDEKVSMHFANETPLEDVLKYIKAATTGPNDAGIPIYVDPAGLAEVGKTMTSTVNLDVEGAPLKFTLRQALRPLGLDYWVHQDGLLEVSSRGAILEHEIGELKEELKRVRDQLKSGGRTPVPSQGDTKPWQKPSRNFDDAQTKSVLAKLEKPLSMSFANDTPLEDVLKYIKSATQGRDDRGIAIYVDPFGLNDAEKTITSPISLDLEGIPLKTSLRLLLAQLGLTYSVKDGVLIISSERSADQPSAFLEAVKKAKQGELTLDEIRELTELMNALSELEKASDKLLNGDLKAKQ
jgi:hypothetical protein